MAYNIIILLYITTTTTIMLLFLGLPASALLNHQLPPHQGELYEEKSRLGSRPPSCYNKCNNCHPCKAVQVPTIPTLDRTPSSALFDSASWDNNRYSNYKPLGWKCSCKDHLYNP